MDADLPTSDGKEQPWKDFWPPKLNTFSAEELAEMPWLSWKPDPEKPDSKPWYEWLKKDNGVIGDATGVVSRRGAG
jgi:hypothetical protein